MITAVGWKPVAGLFVAAFRGAVLAFAILTGFRQIEQRPRQRSFGGSGLGPRRLRRTSRLCTNGLAHKESSCGNRHRTDILPKDRLTVSIDIEHEDESQCLHCCEQLESLPGISRYP